MVPPDGDTVSGFLSTYLQGLEGWRSLANYGPSPPVSINKVLLEPSHTHSLLRL